MALREETKELIFADYSKNLFVYRGLDDMNRPICQKIQYITQHSLFLPALEVQQRLHHRSIVPVLSVRTEESESGTIAIGEFPWAGESLEREVLRRSKDKQQWSEDECILLLDNIVDALAYAQSQGVPHGAVSPSHIFLTESSTFCISGFLGDTEDRPQSLTKSPTFLSPLKRRMYANRLMGVTGSDIQHDPYKSDVYSLGLTLLYLLSPQAHGSFNDCEQLFQLINQLALSQRLKSLLASMLTSEESDRPDSLQVKNSLRGVVESTILSRAHSQLAKKDYTGLKKSLKVLLYSSWIVHADAQSPQLKVLTAPRRPSPQSSRPCKCCSRDYSLLRSDKWRLMLLGSSQAAGSKSYCSERCWDSSLQPIRDTGHLDDQPSADFEGEKESVGSPDTLIIRAKFRYPIGELFLVQAAIIRFKDCGERFYYDCQVHECKFETKSTYFNKVVPTLHGRCPECQPEVRISSYERGLLTCPEYRGRLFFTVCTIVSRNRRRFGKTATAVYAGHYCFPVCITLIAEINSGKCHFCGARATLNWSPFFHSGKPHLICSKACATANLKDCPEEDEYVICPACQEPVDLRSLDCALSEHAGYSSLVGCYLPECCMICFFAASSIKLPCGHNFCSRCLDCLLLKRDGDDFPCLFCGVATPISYLQGLA